MPAKKVWSMVKANKTPARRSWGRSGDFIASFATFHTFF